MPMFLFLRRLRHSPAALRVDNYPVIDANCALRAVAGTSRS